MPPNLDALFKPRSVAFIGGSNLVPTLNYHRDLGFAGDTWVVNPKHKEIADYPCLPSVAALPQAPELAYVAIQREAAVEVIAALRDKGCKAVVCHAAGFAETGDSGVQLQARLVAAAGEMVLLGPNTAGVVNYVDPMAAMMEHFGVTRVERGVAICSQGGGFLCDAVFGDRGLAITHMVGGGNQAALGLEACVAYLLEDARVSAVGLSFEGLQNIAALRRAAAKALHLGKPIVAIKFGKTAAGANAAASHTASMTGGGAAWQALFDRLGIISTDSESEFFETLKLIDAGQIPKGRRVFAASVSGVMGVMLADHLSAAGFELPQPGGVCAARLRELLPAIATPCNPQDVTMLAWNDAQLQTKIYAALLDEGCDIAMMVQNYPRSGMWDASEYEAQVTALGAACAGRDIAALQLAPMVDCFPAAARAHTQQLGLAAMQGLEECIKALSHAVWWYERRAQLQAEGLAQLEESPAPVAAGVRVDESEAKRQLAAAGVAVPAMRVVAADDAAAVAEAAAAVGFPVVVKAVDAALLHKSEVGAVRIGLTNAEEVAAAVVQMRSDLQRYAPQTVFSSVLVEAMVTDSVAEVMASVTSDASVGAVMLLAAGGEAAELWNDSTMLAAPFSRAELTRALQRLKIAKRLHGWRGKPAADMQALLHLLEKLAAFALAAGVEEVEVNPVIVGQRGAWAADAVLKIAPPSAASSRVGVE